jgi:hypothetical protein
LTYIIPFPTGKNDEPAKTVETVNIDTGLITDIFTTKIKTGSNTTEYFLAFLSLVLGFLKMKIWPDFPNESFYVVIAYIINRAIVKAKA